MFISPKFCFLVFLAYCLTSQFTLSAYAQQVSKIKLSLTSKSIEQHKPNLNINYTDSSSQTKRNHRLSMGFGFFGYYKFGILATSVNFLPYLGPHIFLNIGIISYTYINKGEPPNPSLGLQIMYNLRFMNDKLNLYGGGGLFIGLFNDIGGITSVRADYSLSNIIAIGGEVKYLLSKWKFYKYPGFFINCTFNVSPSSKQNKFERR